MAADDRQPRSRGVLWRVLRKSGIAVLCAGAMCLVGMSTAVASPSHGHGHQDGPSGHSTGQQTGSHHSGSGHSADSHSTTPAASARAHHTPVQQTQRPQPPAGRTPSPAASTGVGQTQPPVSTPERTTSPSPTAAPPTGQRPGSISAMPGGLNAVSHRAAHLLGHLRQVLAQVGLPNLVTIPGLLPHPSTSQPPAEHGPTPAPRTRVVPPGRSSGPGPTPPGPGTPAPRLGGTSPTPDGRTPPTPGGASPSTSNRAAQNAGAHGPSTHSPQGAASPSSDAAADGRGASAPQTTPVSRPPAGQANADLAQHSDSSAAPERTRSQPLRTHAPQIPRLPPASTTPSAPSSSVSHPEYVVGAYTPQHPVTRGETWLLAALVALVGVGVLAIVLAAGRRGRRHH